jgi:hypothetical protein
MVSHRTATPATGGSEKGVDEGNWRQQRPANPTLSWSGVILPWINLDQALIPLVASLAHDFRVSEKERLSV